MYLKTPKRYTPKGSKRPLISLRWLWLYLLAPVVIVIGALAWNFRSDITQSIAPPLSTLIASIKINAPTATPTLPAIDIKARIVLSQAAGNLNDAIGAMQDYTAAVPNEVELHAKLAQLLALRTYAQDTGLMKQAQTAGLTAINANPEVADGWVSEALALDWSNQSKAALSYALHGKDLGDLSGLTDSVLAGIYRSLGDTKTAQTFADSAMKSNPSLAYAQYVEGQLAADNGDIKGAISDYKAAWEITKADHTQWGGYIADSLASAYATQGLPDLGKAVIVDALTRDKDDPHLYWRQGRLALANGDYPGAVEAGQNCAIHNQNYTACFELLTSAYYVTNTYEKVVQSAQTAITLNSVATSVYYYGGLANYKLNKCAAAIPMFQAGLVIAQKNNKSDVISQFNAALAECNIRPADNAATGAATAAATPKH